MKHLTQFRDAPVALHDWQGDGAPATAPLLGSLTVTDSRIALTLADGRYIWIEVEDGRLRIHAYAAEGEDRDKPLNLDVLRSGFRLDSSSERRNVRRHCEAPARHADHE